jgi:hypothetical protein
LKKENLTKLIVLTSVIVLCAGIVAFASSLTTEIKAILTQEFTIKYYGEVQEMKDGSGNPVYPIVYNGTTYLPVRAISDMMGIPVDWDASTKTVILGTEEKPPKSVLSFEGKTSDYSSKVTDKASLTVKGANGADIVYNDGVSFRIWNGTSSANADRAYQANIGGGYTNLSFDAYVATHEDNFGKRPYEIIIYNIDNGEKLASITVMAGEINKVEDIDITGVKKIGFAANGIQISGANSTDRAYFFNPIVYSKSNKPVKQETDTDTENDAQTDTDSQIDTGDKTQAKSVLSFEGKTSDYSSRVTDKASLTVKGDDGADIVYNDGVSFRIWNGTSSANADRAYQANIGGGYTKLSFDAYVATHEDNFGKRPYEIIIYNIDNGEKLASITVMAGEINKVEDIDITGVKKIGFAANGIQISGADNTDRAYFFNPTVE